MNEGLESIPAPLLGERLQQARKSARRTQQEVADALGVARTTIVAIEKGERRIQPGELTRLARILGKQVGDFLRTTESSPPLALQLRATLSPEAPIAILVDPYLWEFQQLCDDYLELERICEAPLSRAYPAERPIPNRSLDQAAEDLSTTERIRLGLGDGPLPNLRDMLEREVGLRVFYLPMSSTVDAMFAYSHQYGGCVLVNQNHPEERRRNSLAHEYAHFLTTRQRSEIQVDERYERKPEHERFANTFARAFLMPASGIRRRFNDLRQARSDFLTADLLTLAHHFAVSVESLTLRLEELRLVRSGTWERVRASGLRVREGQASLGLGSVQAADDILPMRYVFLALDAYRRDLLSEERLVRLLRADRLEARRLVQRLDAEGVDDRSAELDVRPARMGLQPGEPERLIDRRVPVAIAKSVQPRPARKKPRKGPRAEEE